MRAAVGRVLEGRTGRSRLRLPRLGLRRRAATTATTDEAIAPVVATPTAYRTFSRKLAPSLTAIGGALALLGGTGPWIRATQQAAETLQAEQSSVVLGYEEAAGRAIAILGVVAFLSAALWLTSRRWLKLLPLCAGLATAGLIAWRLPRLSEEVDELAAAARELQVLDFIAYHAGLGWGAWLLIVSAVLFVMGASVGALRELDLRKGIPDEA